MKRPVEIGQRMKRLRMVKCLSLKQVALEMGLSKSYVSMLEHDTRPWTDELLSLYQKACS